LRKPEAAVREDEALRCVAEREGWDEDDYSAGLQKLDAKFNWWIPNLTAYSAVVILHSLVETQLPACAERLRRDRALKLAVKDIAGRGVE
jgi:hypothetical protein